MDSTDTAQDARPCEICGQPLPVRPPKSPGRQRLRHAGECTREWNRRFMRAERLDPEWCAVHRIKANERNRLKREGLWPREQAAP